MKLLSGDWLSFEYNSNTVKLLRNGSPFSKPFVHDRGIERSVGLVYEHTPQYKNSRPRQFVVGLGGDLPSDPAPLIALLGANKNFTALATRLTFEGPEPLSRKNNAAYIINGMKILHAMKASGVDFAIETDGRLFDEDWVELCNQNNITVILNHDGPGQRGVDVLEEGSETYEAFSKLAPHLLKIRSDMVKDSVSRSDLINHFFGILPNVELPKLSSFRPFELTVESEPDCLYLEDPVIAMVVMYDQFRNGVAEKFDDFWPTVQRLKYRLAMQDYPILESWNRFALSSANLDTVYVDLDGDVYSDPTFDHQNHKIMGNLAEFDDLCEPEPSKFFVHNDTLKNRCRGCPVLPLCLGGNLWTPDSLEEKDCLQRFAFWAPLWTYIMNGYVLESPITGLQQSAFLHKDIYLDFLNSSVYQSAVTGK